MCRALPRPSRLRHCLGHAFQLGAAKAPRYLPSSGVESCSRPWPSVRSLLSCICFLSLLSLLSPLSHLSPLSSLLTFRVSLLSDLTYLLSLSSLLPLELSFPFLLCDSLCLRLFVYLSLCLSLCLCRCFSLSFSFPLYRSLPLPRLCAHTSPINHALIRRLQSRAPAKKRRAEQPCLIYLHIISLVAAAGAGTGRLYGMALHGWGARSPASQRQHLSIQLFNPLKEVYVSRLSLSPIRTAIEPGMLPLMFSRAVPWPTRHVLTAHLS